MKLKSFIFRIFLSLIFLVSLLSLAYVSPIQVRSEDEEKTNLLSEIVTLDETSITPA